MVLKVFHNSGIYVYKDIDSSFFQTHSYGGMKYLQFDIPIKHDVFKYLQEDTRLEYDDQYYLVKGTNERTNAGICTVNAELDLTGLRSKIYLTHKWETVSFDAFTGDILSGTGWTVSNAGLISKRTTIEAKDETPLDLLNRSQNSTLFGTCFEFDTKNKVITVIRPENNTTPSGVYFTDELNLTELTAKGSSSSLITRLYPVGKDGLTIGDVNNGKDYIDNTTYTNKIICAVWRDERYTNKQSLLDDAIVKLSELAKPVRSYTCKVINLAKTNPDIYGGILPIQLYDIITLIDRNRDTRIDHRIVELKEYPANHTLDTVTLSNVAGRITGSLSKIETQIAQLDAQQLRDRTKVNDIQSDLDGNYLKVSESWGSSENRSVITQTATGLYFDVDQIVGQSQWGTKLQQSATDIQLAWNNITKKIQFEAGELRIFDSALEASQQLRSKFNEDGSHFYRSGTYIGKIGTNQWAGNASHKGLVFDLAEDGKWIGFEQKPPGENVYYTMLCFSRDNTIFGQYGIHVGCDLYGHWNTIHNVYLDGVSVHYNGADRQCYTGTIRVMTDNNGSYTNLTVCNGLIIGGS